MPARTARRARRARGLRRLPLNALNDAYSSNSLLDEFLDRLHVGLEHHAHASIHVHRNEAAPHGHRELGHGIVTLEVGLLIHRMIDPAFLDALEDERSQVEGGREFLTQSLWI